MTLYAGWGPKGTVMGYGCLQGGGQGLRKALRAGYWTWEKGKKSGTRVDLEAEIQL